MASNTVDASKYLSGSTEERKAFAKDLVAYFQKDGWVKIQNHGIPRQDIEEWFQGSRQFFNFPRETKLACAHPGGARPVRGFNDGGYEKSSKLHPGNAHVENGKDSLESFNIGPLHDTKNPNQWLPEETLPTFRSKFEAVYQVLQKTASTMLEAIELGLDAPIGSLTSRLSGDPSELRLNHYPRVTKHELCGENLRRIWPHTDFGIITLLFQDREGGLEFEDRQHQNPEVYVPVTSDDQADCILNVSDILQRWTNDVLKAGLHRVAVPRPLQDATTPDNYVLPDRYSIAFFQRPGESASAGPIEKFVDEKRPAAYDEITALQHLERRNGLVY